MQNNVYSNIFWYGDMLLHGWAKNEHFPSLIYCTKYMEKSDINSLVCIFISTVQEMFHEKVWNFTIS